MLLTHWVGQRMSWKSKVFIGQGKRLYESTPDQPQNRPRTLHFSPFPQHYCDNNISYLASHTFATMADSLEIDYTGLKLHVFLCFSPPIPLLTANL
jgi:hypothetical protein